MGTIKNKAIRQILSLIIVCLFISNGFSQDLNSKSDFSVIDSFYKNKPSFNKDTFNLKDYSTEGGVLSVFHSSKFDFIVLDFWIYGEMGKYNWIYFTDKDFKFIIVNRIDYNYDKPFYIKDYKVTKQIRFITFANNKAIRAYSSNREIIKIGDDNLSKESSELVNGFSDMTKDIKIIK